jgi:hypothetical protein
MDLKKCRKDKSYVIKDKDNFIFKYQEYGKKVIYLSVKDKYGDTDSKKEVINVEKSPVKKQIMSVPKLDIDNGQKTIYVGKNLNNSVLYYLIDTGCYLDPDISVDDDKDGDPANDKTVNPGQVVLYKYFPKSQYTYARLYCRGKSEDIKVYFIDYENIIPENLKDVATKLDEIIRKLSSPKYANNDQIVWLKTLLINLKNNL